MAQSARQIRSPLDDFVAVTRAAGDRLRAGILRVLRTDAFGVLELCHIFAMAQPAMSHHLKVLHQAGLVARHREGNSVFYRRRTPEGADLATTNLQSGIFEAIDAMPVPAELAARLETVYDRRRASSEAFFADNADALASQQTLISPAGAYADSVVDAWRKGGNARGHALEIGPGDGELLARLASDYATVRGIDSSSQMLRAARERCAHLANVRIERREFGELPARARYDLVVAAMVLHHMPSPARFFQHAAAMLRPAGLLVIAELAPHAQEWVHEACGDLWLGFEPAALEGWAHDAGLEPGDQEFLAQKNGFRVQTLCFIKPANPRSGDKQ